MSSISRRTFLRAGAGAALLGAAARAQNPSPNVILILADDLGYGDLGCYGSKIATPNLDGMAREGVRFTQFYSASPVCSASRAGLLTGRYPTRLGIPSVLFPWDDKGIPENETTLAQALKPQGYRTMCVGKWHLGAKPRFLPTNRGFDEYFGLPYSNDMTPCRLLRNTEVIEEPTRLDSLTVRYTEEAARFIARSKDSPFFLFLSHNSPHIPLATSGQFRGASGLGAYGDTVTEMDWSAGEVLRAVKENGLDDNTLVMFLSDNGPWYQGSAGRLRGRKGETWEGGVRVPFLARFPGRIPAESVREGVGSALDILPTVAGLTGAPLPPQALDGANIWPLLAGELDELDRGVLLYFDRWHLQCARAGPWKLHVSRPNAGPWTPPPEGGRWNLPLPKPELYDLAKDPEESCDIAADNAYIVSWIREHIEGLLPTFPREVTDAWTETMRIPVEDTPSGARPVRRAVAPADSQPA